MKWDEKVYLLSMKPYLQIPNKEPVLCFCQWIWSWVGYKNVKVVQQNLMLKYIQLSFEHVKYQIIGSNKH